MTADYTLPNGHNKSGGSGRIWHDIFQNNIENIFFFIIIIIVIIAIIRRPRSIIIIRRAFPRIAYI